MIKIIVSDTAGNLETATNEAITDLTGDSMTISGVAVSVGDSVPWYAVITYAEATTEPDAGGDNSGGDNSGGDNSGGDNSGGDNSGGDNSGGDTSGDSGTTGGD